LFKLMLNGKNTKKVNFYTPIMKYLLIFSFALLFTTALDAQDTAAVEGPWNYKGMASLNFSQVSLTNWAQGGESSYAVNALSAFDLNYTKNNNSWTGSLDVGYGIQKTSEKMATKTDDHLEMMSKYGRKASGFWYFNGMLNFRTQFTRGYKGTTDGRLVISDFLSPGYIIFSLGMEYKKDESFFAALSPVSSKITVVVNDSLSAAGSFGLSPGEKTRLEIGASVRIGLSKDLMENVSLTSTLDLFSNYLDKPQNIDISWKALVNMKINRFLSVNISTHMIYDDDIAYVDNEGISQGPRVQFKEMLGVGLSYKF